MINQEKKRKLIDRIKQIGFSNQTETLLTIENYFDGYDDVGCTICANNVPEVSTAEFQKHLSKIRTLPEVNNIYVRFCDFQDAEAFGDCWINSDMVFVVTTATPKQVEAWFESVCGTETYEETDYKNFVNLPEIPDGYKLIGIGWD